jgi:cytochrome c oxidase subunit IV
MEHTEVKPRLRWHLCAAAFVPFIPLSVYLYLIERFSFHAIAFESCVVLAMSVLAGAVFVMMLPISWRRRALALFIYVPVLSALLFFYAFWFIGVFFHDGI